MGRTPGFLSERIKRQAVYAARPDGSTTYDVARYSIYGQELRWDDRDQHDSAEAEPNEVQNSLQLHS